MRINPNQRKTNYSSFAVPLILAVLFLIIIVKIFFWWSTNTWIKNTNEGFVNVDSNQEKSEIYIYMSWDSKKLIEWSTKMYPTDTKMEVASWEWKINFDWNNTKIYVNKLGELKYNWKSWDEDSFKVLNWDIWVEWNSKTKFELKNIIVSSSSAILSFSQNMVASSIYVLKWEANITMNWNPNDAKITTIWVWQKITVMNSEITQSDFRLDEKIEPIDDFFKQSDFFIKHNGSSYLSSNTESTWTWLTQSGSSSNTKGKVIIITYPEDEATIEDNKLNIEWKITSSNVDKITLNDKEASINKWDNTFIAKDFILDSSINNVVYKAYDSSNNLITKWVLTIYTSSKNTSKDEEIKKPTVTTYPLSSSDFKIIEPSDNPYKTTDNIVKIAWAVNKWAVKFITINDFRLTKFSQFSSNWYYFANQDYGTMNDWINLYTIKYYGKDDDLLYTSLFTIVKESKTKDEPVIEKEKTWSWNSSSNW